MVRWLPVALAVGVAMAQDGASIFNKSCAVGYCHGTGGTAGRAPKLVGRAFEHAFVHKVTRDGVPNTGMPGWKDRLSGPELDAVIAYVVNISGGKLDPKLSAAASAGPTMPAAVKAGRDRFFDKVRGERRCSTCHAVEELGIAVGPNLVSAGTFDVAGMRNGKPATVRKATTRSGESFSALVVEQKPESVVVFDLALPLPVLRTFDKGALSFAGGAAWQHSRAVEKYTDDDLRMVGDYLRWLASR
jgi:mono/diheme cytochrome c family protein